jgi:hypothetical protein
MKINEISGSKLKRSLHSLDLVEIMKINEFLL